MIIVFIRSDTRSSAQTTKTRITTTGCILMAGNCSVSLLLHLRHEIVAMATPAPRLVQRASWATRQHQLVMAPALDYGTIPPNAPNNYETKVNLEKKEKQAQVLRAF